MKRLGDPSFGRLGIQGVPWGFGRLIAKGYIRKVLTPNPAVGYDPSSLIGFWPQNELAGGVSIDYSGLGHNGLYTGVTLGQPGVPGMGMTSPFYDGANDYNNVYSASLNTEFDGAEGTLILWARVAAGAWTDGVLRRLLTIGVDGNNRILLFKSNVNNNFQFTYSAGGTTETQGTAALSNLDYACYAITWSKSALPTGEVRYYIAGVPSGAMDTGLGVWVGNLAANTAVIGAASTGPAAVWSGGVAPALLYNTAKTPAEIAYLSEV